MTQAYGGREGQFPFTIEVPPVGISSVASDDETYILPAGWEGYLDINKCIQRCTIAVQADITDGKVIIKKNNIAIGTYTSTDNDAVNLMFGFVPESGYESGVNLTGGDSIIIATTQAADSVLVRGTFIVYIAVYLSQVEK